MGDKLGSRVDPHTGVTWAAPTTEAPDEDVVLEWMDNEGEMLATDGCDGIEDDGVCEHGHASWALYLGLI